MVSLICEYLKIIKKCKYKSSYLKIIDLFRLILNPFSNSLCFETNV